MTQTEQELININRAISNGNRDAEEFCGLFFQWCHQIDDLIDTREDGRPTLSSEEILSMFINSLIVYNHPFYIANREMLRGAILMVTNMYADSVAFEKAPEPEKRAIADVIRCCGNEVLMLVAGICGGWDHMRKLSPVIRQRSWLLQHDKEAQQF